jgi:OmpA-OmpF porin, OOP family
LLDIQADFAFNSAELSQDTRNALKALAEKLKGNHVSVLIEGHADGVGPPVTNLTLSRRRAEAVKQFLVENGVIPEQLHKYGYGQGYFWLPYVPSAGENRRIRVIQCTVEGLNRCLGS